jgi:hypothetical protein
VPPKHWLTLSELRGVISQKLILLTAGRFYFINARDKVLLGFIYFNIYVLREICWGGMDCGHLAKERDQ